MSDFDRRWAAAMARASALALVAWLIIAAFIDATR
jgi:hypothetical protein